MDDIYPNISHETVGKYKKNNVVFITVTRAPVQMTKKGGFIPSVLNTVTHAPVQMTRKKVGIRLQSNRVDSCSGSKDDN